MPSEIITCLWFDGNALEAAEHYAAHLPDARVGKVHRAPADNPAMKEGGVLSVDFVVAGQKFFGLNGGPLFKFNEAVSFQILVDTQEEIDRLTAALSAVPEAERCGWVKDRFGVSWQIVPRRLSALLGDPDRARARRAMQAMLTMNRLDIAALERAADG